MGHRLKQTIVVWCDTPSCNRNQEYPGNDLTRAMFRATQDGWQLNGNRLTCFRCAARAAVKQKALA